MTSDRKFTLSEIVVSKHEAILVYIFFANIILVSVCSASLVQFHLLGAHLMHAQAFSWMVELDTTYIFFLSQDILKLMVSCFSKWASF